jgi:hypothetical protein
MTIESRSMEKSSGGDAHQVPSEVIMACGACPILLSKPNHIFVHEKPRADRLPPEPAASRSATNGSRLMTVDQGLKAPAFPDNLPLKPNRRRPQKFFTAPLKPKMDFFIFPVPPRGGAPTP